jgi:hypothetical protein
VSNRNMDEPGNRNNNIGLRCAGDAGNACQTGKRPEPDGIMAPAGSARPLPTFGPGEPRKLSPKHQPTPRPVVAPADRAKLGGEDTRKTRRAENPESGEGPAPIPVSLRVNVLRYPSVRATMK